MSLHRTRVGSRVGSATRADARRPDYAKVLVRDPTGGVLAQAARRVPQPYSTRPSVMVARACFARISARTGCSTVQGAQANARCTPSLLSNLHFCIMECLRITISYSVCICVCICIDIHIDLMARVWLGRGFSECVAGAPLFFLTSHAGCIRQSIS